MKNQRIQQVIARVRGTFDGFTRGQRAITVIAIVVAIGGGVLFYRWVSQPVMTPLYPGTTLSQQDAGAVTTALDGLAVPYTLQDTTISVPREQVEKARIDLASQNLPAQTNQQDGYSLVENAPMTTSDAQQRVLIKRATEGELKKAIEKIETVQSATVQLALPEPDVFTRDQAPTTASVLVAPKPNQTLSGGQVEAITHLVASAVPKLDSGKVTVTDSNGALLSTSGAAGASGMSEQRVAQQASYQSGVSSQLQALLDKTVGPGNSTVAVRADLDFSNTREWTNEYIQPQAGAPPLQTDTTRELYNGTGQTPVGGVLGPDNIPVPNTDAGSNASEYEKTGEKSINPYGTRQTYRDGTAGQVGRLNVSVLLDSRTTGAMPLGPIQTAVCAAAGIDTARQDTCTVAKVPFDTAAAQAAAATEAAAQEQARQDELIQLAKNVGLGLLLLLALLIGFRQNRKRTRTIDVGELESVQGPLLPELPGAPAAIEAGPPAEFELDSDESLRVLQATPVDPQSHARVEARGEIGKLVQENPDEVARLLRGWITERS